MFVVVFEVHPSPVQWDSYLSLAKMLRPELEQVPGFIDNVRYRSLTREGWILSLSTWEDEKALVRWRTKAKHHEVQEKGRGGVLTDYHLRVGQVTADSQIPRGMDVKEQRLDQTVVGEGAVAVLVQGRMEEDWVKTTGAKDVARRLGLIDAAELGTWDVFDAVLTPGDVILLCTFRDEQVWKNMREKLALNADHRIRAVRVVRDYGMFDRREAPQYYPDAEGRETVHT